MTRYWRHILCLFFFLGHYIENVIVYILLLWKKGTLEMHIILANFSSFVFSFLLSPGNYLNYIFILHWKLLFNFLQFWETINSIVSFILIRIFYSFQAELIRVYDTTKSKPEGLWASLLLGAGPALLSWSASVTIKWWWCRSDWDSDCLLTNLYWLSLLKSLFLQVEPHYCSLQTGEKKVVCVYTQ